MVLYKSFCRSPKTFYGVTFNYGESKAVPGYIHDRRFVCLNTNYTSPEPQLKVTPAVVNVEVASKPAASTGKDNKKSEPKKEEKKSESKKSEPKKAEKPAAKNSDSKSKVDEKSSSDMTVEPKKEEKKS